MRLAASLGLAASLLLAGVAMPAAGLAMQRGGLASTACTVEPRTPEEISALVAAATPEPTPPDGEAADSEDWTGSLADLPQGEPADPQTVDEITAAVREFAGCLNAAEWERWLALMTDRLAATVVSSVDATDPNGQTAAIPAGVPTPPITAVRIGKVSVLEDGRITASVAMRGFDREGKRRNQEAAVLVFQSAGDGWLLDEVVSLSMVVEDRLAESEGDTAPPPGSAPEGYDEVDSVMYAEPTMAGAKFSIVATVMVGFVGNDDYRGASCEMFVLERGETSATLSAFCWAEEGLVGRAAYLDVEAYGPRRGSETATNRCRDDVVLAGDTVLSCTVDLPEPAP
jgi:ketosteroid isomerase-like protein